MNIYRKISALAHTLMFVVMASLTLGSNAETPGFLAQDYLRETSKLVRWLGRLLAASALLAGFPALADGPTCQFWTADPTHYGPQGDSAMLIRDGSIKATTPSVYGTSSTVDVGLWIDDSFAALDPDAPGLALSYLEHANCIYAKGLNKLSQTGNHSMSLRLAGARIRYFPVTAPTVFMGSPWIQEVHWDWRAALAAANQALPNPPKLNLLVTARVFADFDYPSSNWKIVGGAANGIGQGQALISVNPDDFRNEIGQLGDVGVRAHVEDWWGVIAAHEIGHALGRNGHSSVKYDTMCCVDGVRADYTDAERGFVASKEFSSSDASWTEILRNNWDNTDQFPDPYATEPNPETNEIWDFPQISDFLDPDASIWRYTGTPCGADSCPGWQRLDINPKSRYIAAADNKLYQMHDNGAIWGYTGTPCTGLITCTGWLRLDNNPGTAAIAAGGGELYQLHKTGAIWSYTGVPCSSDACPGWQQLDNNPGTVTITATGTALYQLHNNGAIWRYTNLPCIGASCPGWQRLDNNPKTVAIAAGGTALYQLHSNGAIWRYKNLPCTGASCPGWQRLDKNPRTVAIAAGNTALYQLHNNGAIWRYTGTPCVGASCPGWQRLDNNPKAVAIVAGNEKLYQQHNDGAVWQYTGTPCGPSGCPGWQRLDNNAKTKTIAAGNGTLFQVHGREIK